MTAANSVGRTVQARRDLARIGPPFLGLVVVELVFGMVLNLFVTLPTGSLWVALTTSPVLDVHFLIGFLLLGISANALRLSFGFRSIRPIVMGTVGFVSAIAAFGAGTEFVVGTGSADASFDMSLGLVGLLLEAGYLLTFMGTRGPSGSTADGALAGESGRGSLVP